MSAKLKKVLKDLQKATCPEEIFGELVDGSVQDSYRKWCKNTHEDLCAASEKHLAHEAFILLGKFLKEAEFKINAKTYGDKNAAIKEIIITTKRSEYKIGGLLFHGDIADTFQALSKDKKVLIKIPRNLTNNDLIKSETKNIFTVRDFYLDKDDKILRHIPELIDTCELPDGKNLKRANIFNFREGFVTLQDIIDAYPKGIDPRDMAWMFNRMMSALLAAHQTNIIHGAVTPEHILLNPKDHNGILIDWSYSVKKGGIIRAISPKYKDFYPTEIFDKKPAKFGLDLYMLAKCMQKLLGENWKSTPMAIKGLLNSCLLGYTKREEDVWQLYQEFGLVLTSLYGPRKFRTFVMPDAVNK